MRSIFYLDTSGLNFLADNMTDFSFLAQMKANLGFELFLSPVSLWEVLLNSDEKRRDYLIYWSQFNCADKLIKSPSEIVVEYIRLGCPEKDWEFFIEDPYSKTDIGVTWNNIHGKISRTIPVNIEELKERTKPIRQLSKKLKSIVNDMCDDNNDNYENDHFHKAMKQVRGNLGHESDLDEKTERIYKISLIFVFFVICIGFELQNDVVRGFWSEKKIEDPFDRFAFIIEHHADLVIRGPISEMAIMADTQLQMKNAKSRGLLHDCMHTIYCYYADNLITSDIHFKALKENEINPIFNKIIMTTEIQQVWETAIKASKSNI